MGEKLVCDLCRRVYDPMERKTLAPGTNPREPPHYICYCGNKLFVKARADIMPE